jgi:hypothetical protein
MQLLIKPVDSTSDDPNFVILEERDPHATDHHYALRLLASRAASCTVYVGDGDPPVWRRLRLFFTA